MANIYIETFGCQMNEADSQYIADRAAAAGYAVTSDPKKAGVVVLNTCTVRDNAEARAYGRMQQLRALKTADPTLKLIVCGCLAEQDRDRMQKRAPHVDAVFGTALEDLALLGDTLARWRPDFADDEEYADERALLENMGGRAADCVADSFTHLRAFTTVQRGCSYYCTFCIVPYVRGRFEHRPMDVILKGVRAQIAAGAREIMLVGQTVNAWRDPENEALDFGDLCRAVAGSEGLERLTFISPHPKDFTEKIVRDFVDIPQLNPRVHLPLQSGSDVMLRRMNRKYDMETYRSKVELFRRYLPHWAITTDIIVGFPGETEDDFRATCDYVASSLFAQAFMFVYSPRRGTPAAQWEQVPPAVATERFKRLVAAQDASCRAYHERKIGTVVRCLIQGVSKKDRTKLAAKSLDNVTMIVPMPPGYEEAVYAREPWLDVRVERVFTWGGVGTIVRRAERFADEGTLLHSPVIDLTVL
jgi:tRNA-2-methylthio-N6-dimethylallyladenosine synthase